MVELSFNVAVVLDQQGILGIGRFMRMYVITDLSCILYLKNQTDILDFVDLYSPYCMIFSLQVLVY